MVMVRNFTQIPNELFQARNLSVKAIGLYSYLKFKSYTGNAHRVFPSQKRIMKELNIGSDNTVRKIVTELIENNFLTVKKGSIFTGNSQYKLLVPKICED